MNLRTFVLSCAFVFLVAQLPNHAYANDANTDGWLPIKIEHGRLLVQSSLAGFDGYSLIDHRANSSAVNTDFLQKNTLRLKSRGVTGVQDLAERNRGPYYRDVPATLLGVDVEFSKLDQVSLDRQDVQFILGADFLELGVFQFDYPNARMRLLDRDTVNLGELSNVKSRVDSTCNVVNAEVRLKDAQNVWLTVDTAAASGVLMERSIVAQHDWLTSYPSELLNVRGVNAGSTVEQFRLPVLQIGNFEVTDVPVRVPAKGNNLELFDRPTRTDSNLRCRRGKAQGLLGYEVLKDFVLTIDYRKGKIHLQPTTTS